MLQIEREIVQRENTYASNEIENRRLEQLHTQLNSFNLQLLYEAGQLFAVLLDIEQLEEPLLRALLKLIIDAADPRRGSAVPLHMQASAARALGQLVAALPPDRRERCTVELDLVPWLCTLLTRETFSPECQKAAVQSLQLLGLCEGAPLDTMGTFLGDVALAHIMEAQDATQAALSLSPELLSVLHPQIDAFLAVHRRSLKPEPLQVNEALDDLLDAVPPAAAAEEEAVDIPPKRVNLAGGPASSAPAAAA